MSGVNIAPRSSPFPPTSSFSSSQSVGTGSLQHPSESEQLLHATLSRFAAYVRKTRLQLQPFFADWDKHKQGSISRAQFGRVLASIGFGGHLTHSLVELLCDSYAVAGDPTSVYFRSFVADVERIAQAQQQRAMSDVQRAQAGPTLDFEATLHDRPLVSREAAVGAMKGTASIPNPAGRSIDVHGAHAPLTTDKLLHKIQHVCQTQRIILNDLFQDYDPLRKHMVTLSRFRRALDVAGFRLSDEEMNTLVTRYLSGKDSNFVEYARFIRDVQAPFIPDQAEADPLKELPAFTPYKLEEQETPTAHFTVEERERLSQLLREFGYQVHTRRILLRPAFQHHDPIRSGCVTARQFGSVVAATFTHVRISTRDMELLCDKYRRSSLGIYYVAFLNDVAEEEANAGEYAKTLHPSYAAAHLEATGFGAPPLNPLPRAGHTVIAGMRVSEPGRPASAHLPRDHQEVLQRIKSTLSRLRLSIDDIFGDFDPLKHGRVTRAQFFRALSSVGLQLSPAEVRLLTEAYPHSEIPEDVDYRSFIQHLSSIPRF